MRHADLMQDARPWANYETDYAPLVHFAKDVGMPVIAANAPRRYVGAVGRDPDALRGQMLSAKVSSPRASRQAAAQAVGERNG